MKLKVGGVPEHFNSPWKNAIASGKFDQIGVNVEFIEYPGGTGAMCNALESGEVDIALLLTEGAIARALNNSAKQDTVNFKLCATYVKSPLLWGVHVSKNSHFETLEDLTGAPTGKEPIFAISRYGSGSHLMSYVMMQELTNQSKLDLSFEVVKNLVGAKEALPKNDRLVFLWEHFMTDPLVQEGFFKRIGDQPTPWPCFVVAVRDGVLTTEEALTSFRKVLEIVKGECTAFKTSDKTVDNLKENFRIEKKLGAQWLSSVEFHCEPGLSNEDLLAIADRLYGLERVDSKPDKEMIANIILNLP